MAAVGNLPAPGTLSGGQGSCSFQECPVRCEERAVQPASMDDIARPPGGKTPLSICMCMSSGFPCPLHHLLMCMFACKSMEGGLRPECGYTLCGHSGRATSAATSVTPNSGKLAPSKAGGNRGPGTSHQLCPLLASQEACQQLVPSTLTPRPFYQWHQGTLAHQL